MIYRYKDFIKENVEYNLSEIIEHNRTKLDKSKYKIHHEGIIIDGDFDITYRNFSNLPFNNIYCIIGHFNCSHNNLTSLEGCPKIITKDFECSYNDLKTLKGSPTSCDSFFCQHNLLTSFDYIPKYIKGDCLLFDQSKEMYLEDYPLSIIDGVIVWDKSDNPLFEEINMMINSNKKEFEPFVENEDKIGFHKLLISKYPDLVKYYKNWFPFNKKNGKLII